MVCLCQQQSTLSPVPLLRENNEDAIAVDGNLAAVADGMGGAPGGWDELRSVAVYDGPPLWVHGDLHPANIIVSEGALAAVIDFGDLTAGDRSVDVASGIMLLDPGPLTVFRDAAGVGNDEDLWRRAYGWALLHGVYCAGHSADNPIINAVGRKTVTAVLRDCG